MSNSSGGVSGSSETVLTDIENNSLWSDFALCNFAEPFYAETATFHTKEI